MRGLIINHNTSYCKDLFYLFGDECDIVNYQYFSTEQANKYDFIVLSGGEIHISDDDDIYEEKQFLKATTKPIFAVCLGMQIVCVINDLKLGELPQRIKGEYFLPYLESGGQMTYNHGWYIGNIPNGFDGIIEDGIVKAIWNEKVLGFQGHPELSGEYGQRIKEYFIQNYIS